MTSLETQTEPHPILPNSTLDTSSLNPALAAVLQHFPTVFSIPHGLPPHRNHDHHIHLLPDSTPVNVRPYRYPQYQK